MLNVVNVKHISIIIPILSNTSTCDVTGTIKPYTSQHKESLHHDAIINEIGVD